MPSVRQPFTGEYLPDSGRQYDEESGKGIAAGTIEDHARNRAAFPEISSSPSPGVALNVPKLAGQFATIANRTQGGF